MSEPTTTATARIPSAPRGAEGAPRAARDEPARGGLGATVRRGSAWSLAGYAGTQVLRFAGNLALTRLLVPEALGLMALVNALLQGLQLFSDIGIGPSIIQSPRGEDRAFLNTAWTLQVLRGGLLALAALALGPPFAALYGEPLLAQVIPVSALCLLIGGFQSARIFSAYRRVDLARVSLVELGSQAAGLACMVAIASARPTIWALVAGGLAGAVARTILSHTVLPGIPDAFRWDRDSLVQLARFGRWIFASTVLTFFVSQSDRLLFGALIPLGLLGVYSVAWMISAMPALALGRMASSVAFPVYSRVLEAGQPFAPVFKRVRLPLLVLGGWMISGLVGGGQAAVRLLYDERYADAGWMLQVLALGSWFAVVEATHASALLAKGEARWTAASGAAKLAAMLALIPLGFRLGGFPGAVAGLAASELVKYACSAGFVARAGLRVAGQDLGSTAWMLGAAALAWSASNAVQARGASDLAVAAVVLLVVSVAWTPPALACLVRRRR